MNTYVVTRINIAAQPAEIFEYLTDLRYHHLWNPQVESISTTAPLILGGGFDSVSIVLGVQIYAKNVVTKLVKPTELELENTTGLVKYRAYFRLKAMGDEETLLICKTTVSSDSGAFSFAKPILKTLARRELQSDLKALQTAVEQRLQ
jgi:hypothetical protein